MPRRREVEKRSILPDPKFGSVELSKFINILMESGKKAVAEKIVYNALELIKNKSKKDGIEVFKHFKLTRQHQKYHNYAKSKG